MAPISGLTKTSVERDFGALAIEPPCPVFDQALDVLGAPCQIKHWVSRATCQIKHWMFSGSRLIKHRVFIASGVNTYDPMQGP